MAQMNDAQLQSKVIQWMRFPLAVAIVFLHCSSASFEENAVYSFVRSYISVTMVGIAVPIFFFISGFLFFLNVDVFTKEIYFKKIKNRVKSLLIPYVSWNILCAGIPLLILLAIVIKNNEPTSLLLDYLKDLRGWHIFWDYNQWNEHSSGPIDLPLWFVRDLMIITLLTPIIYYLKYKLRMGFILLVVGLYILEHFVFLHINTRAVLFYSLGAYLALEKVSLVHIAKKYGKISSLIVLLLSVILSIYSGQLYLRDYIYQIFVIFAFIVIFYIGIECINSGRGKLLLLLSQCSFFIYAAHEVKIYEICLFLSDKLFGGQDTRSLLLHYFCYPISTTLICIIVYFTLKRFASPLLLFLTGNR